VGALTETVLGLMNCIGIIVFYRAAATLFADKLNSGGAPATPRQAVGITKDKEVILRGHNIKSEAWIVDAFYHNRQRAEDDRSRLINEGRLKLISDVVEVSRICRAP
jgi:hypothetical protein